MVVGGSLIMKGWNLFVGHFRDSMLSVMERAAQGTTSLGELFADDALERLLKQSLWARGHALLASCRDWIWMLHLCCDQVDKAGRRISRIWIGASRGYPPQ